MVENVPAMQAMQSEAESLPSDATYLPAPQSMHPDASLLPALVEYFPAGHSWHAAVPGAA